MLYQGTVRLASERFGILDNIQDGILEDVVVPPGIKACLRLPEA